MCLRPHRLMGTAPGFVSETLDRDIIDEIYLVSEGESFERCREIARVEGLLVGISSGAVAHAALTIARRPENAGKMIIILGEWDIGVIEGLPVSLRVLKVNPARRLYKRLGFVVVEEVETHYNMKATPS